MDRGNLAFAIANAGTVDIHWKNIERLESTRSFEVETTSGAHLSGPIRTVVPGQLEIPTDRPAHRTDGRGASDGNRWGDRAPADLRVGGVGPRVPAGEPRGELYARCRCQESDTFLLTEARFSSLLTHLNGEDFASRNDFELQTRRLFPGGWFVPVQFLFQQDQALELDSRFLIDAAVGKYLVQGLGTSLGAYIGVDYAVSQYREVPGTNHAVEALGTAEWDWFESTSKTELKTFVTTYVGLNESRVRVEWDADIRRDLFRTFYLSIHLFDSYNSNPPASVAQTNDFGLSFGIGYSF